MKAKRIILFIFVLFVSIALFGCDNQNENTSIAEEIKKQIVIPNEIYEDIELKNTINVNGEDIIINYVMSNDALSSDGVINPQAEDDTVVNVKVKTENEEIDLGNKTVLSMKAICEKTIDSLTIPKVVDRNLYFPTQIGRVKFKWNTSNVSIISRTGECAYITEDANVKITCQVSMKTEYDSYQYTKEYDVTVTRLSADTRYDLVMEDISIPNEAWCDINLPQKLDYDVKCSWKANSDAIDKIGHVKRLENDVNVNLELTLYCDDSDIKRVINYEVKVLKAINAEGEMNFYNHILINRANELKESNMNGLVYADGKVKLKDDTLVGIYESDIYNTLNFYRIVGSFSCITSPTATCELEYSIRVDGKWSKYLSYGEFGLGRNNLYYNQTDIDAMIDTDMVIPLHNKEADGLKYRLTLRRDKLATASPELSLVASALFIKNYSYAVDASSLPDSVDWDVPKLYQHDVPNIGGVICSATTTTMLLKFAGYDFSDKGYQYEHQYMANMVADKGHNNPTYGNWSYNMMTAGAFGINAYVGKFYSWDEIRYHLANYGPIGVSIGGNFGIYSTNGHLLVLRGYRIENGETTVICNDPNVKGVYYEVSLDIFLNAWGSVVYIMEFDNLK